MLAPKTVVSTVPKNNLLIALPDKTASFLRSGIVYKFKCGSCNGTYYDKTKHHFKVRICKYFGISAFTGKRAKSDYDSAIKGNFLFCNHTPDYEDFSTLPRATILKLH